MTLKAAFRPPTVTALAPPRPVPVTATVAPAAAKAGISDVTDGPLAGATPSSRPMRLPARSPNQMAPSAPVVIELTWELNNSGVTVHAPLVVIRMIPWSLPSPIQSAPSGPVVIDAGAAPEGRSNSVTAPVVVIRPTRSVPYIVNQTAPSGPTAIASGSLPGTGYEVTMPAVVIAAIDLGRATQSRPSGPEQIASELTNVPAGLGGSGMWVKAPPRASRPTESVFASAVQSAPSGPSAASRGCVSAGPPSE